ncbi:MAG: helix-turn-helix domain-containing protein [Christensenellales bacterium]|jgi:transcriptional regulator with XRE-family HTH domain
MDSDALALKRAFSKQFRRIRTKLDLSQAAMSELLGITPRAYSDLEQGKSLCSTTVLSRFLTYCCLDSDRLEIVETIVDVVIGCAVSA